MLKEKWSTGLRKGLIISLNVLLMLSSALFFGGREYVFAANVQKTTSHYNLNISDSYSGTDDMTSIVVSWAPNSQSSSIYAETAVITFNYGGTPTYVYRIIMYGSGSVSFNIKGLSNVNNSNVNVSTGTYWEIGSDIDYLEDINDQLNNGLFDLDTIISYLDVLQRLYTDGIKLKNYDVTLSQIPILAYYLNNGATMAPTNLFVADGFKFFDYPVITGYNNSNEWDSAQKALYMRSGFQYILIVMTRGTVSMFNPSRFQLIRSNDYPGNITLGNPGTARLSSTAQINFIPMSTDQDTYFKMYWSSSSSYFTDNQYIPLYFGWIQNCPDEILGLINMKKPDEQQAETTSEDLDDINTEFNSQVSEIDDIQNDLEDDFQTNIQAIDTDLDFEASFGQKFVTSALWVRTQFETLTTQTPYGSILFFALTLGLALMIIGRVI